MIDLGIRELRELFVERCLSVSDHVDTVLATIRAADPGLGAFLSVAGEEAQRAAEWADERIRELGRAAWHRQPLLGVTVSVKDLIQTGDLPTTRGSKRANDRLRTDAPVVARLRAAGAIIVGKTTTSEYGWSASTVSQVAEPTRNPWSLAHTAGGSSGGAAASVAAELCDAALGTDGAGSIRIPAAFCGVVGYKPSFGLVPYVPPGADRLAHLGPLTRNVADAIELTAAIAGPDRLDPDTGARAPALPRVPRPLRIAWLEFPGTTEAVRSVTERAWPALTGLGHRLTAIEVPFSDPYPALVDIIAAAEAAGTGPADEEGADPGRLAVVRYGRTVSGAAVVRAEQVRLALRARLHEVMAEYDLLAMATVPIEPFGAHAIAPDWAADPADLRWLAWAPAAYPVNLTGQPAISIPVGLTPAGLPAGLQLVGPAGGDGLLLAAARDLEAELDSIPRISEGKR